VSEKDTTGTGKPFNITGLPETGQCHRHTVHTVQAGLGVYPGKGSRDGIFITRREESWHSYNVYYNVILKTKLHKIWCKIGVLLPKRVIDNLAGMGPASTIASYCARSRFLQQEAYGKGEVEIPVREMPADIQPGSGHPEQALAEYQRVDGDRSELV
jgi:hypothetical protein